MYRIGLKLWSINTKNYLKEAERLYNEGIYDYIELYIVPDSMNTLTEWSNLHIPFIIHNAHFAHGFNLAKKEQQASNRKIFTQTRRFADELKAEYIIFHGGIDGEPEQTAKQLAELNEPRALLENKPFIALPNRMGGNFCRGASYDELKAILEYVGCGFCLDFGHAVCAAVSQNLEPYEFIHKLMSFSPVMFHLSDVMDMTSPYDAHPHLGTGKLDFCKLKSEILPPRAVISVETDKDLPSRLDDFVHDVEFLRHV